AGLDQVAKDGANCHGGAFHWSVRRNAENASVGCLDILRRLVALEDEQGLAGFDRFAILFVPGNEHALLHVPAQARHTDLDRHDSPLYSASRSRTAWTTASTLGMTAASSGGLYGVGVGAPLRRRIGT